MIVFSVSLIALSSVLLFIVVACRDDGKMVVSKPLYVALAQRKEERRARLLVLLLVHVLYSGSNGLKPFIGTLEITVSLLSYFHYDDYDFKWGVMDIKNKRNMFIEGDSSMLFVY
ncbi:hypothetical protein SLE2022_301630 [Rubroshorea leprosula]